MPSLWENFVGQIRLSGGCWEWAGCLTPTGYGTVTRNRKICAAHRVAWEYANGPLPTGMCVCHECDNPKCVRPSHLFLGTHKDNADDKVRKKRHRFGDTHHNSRLTEQQVIDARVAYAAGGTTMARLAKFHGTNAASMRDILYGKHYRHVGGPLHVPRKQIKTNAAARAAHVGSNGTPQEAVGS